MFAVYNTADGDIEMRHLSLQYRESLRFVSERRGVMLVVDMGTGRTAPRVLLYLLYVHCLTVVLSLLIRLVHLQYRLKQFILMGIHGGVLISSHTLIQNAT